MKRGWPRLAAVTLVLILLATCLAGCGRQEAGPDEGTEPGSGDETTGPDLKTLAVTIDTEADRKIEAEAIAQQLRDIGVQAEVRVWEWSALKPKLLDGERLMYMTDWGSAFFDPYDLGVPKLRTDDRGNYSFYSNPQVDELFNTAITTADPATRRQAYHEVQAVLNEDAPWVFGYIIKSIYGVSSQVRGFEPAMDTRINLHDTWIEGGDTIVVGLRRDAIMTLDPATYRDRETETVIRNIFDGLVTRTPDGQVVPEIAESWTISEDGRTYTFHLRDDVTFHNGAKLTAADVVFTFERVLGLGDFDEPSPRAGLIQPAGVDVTVARVDDRTVVFTFSEPFPVFLQGLVHQQIVPRAYFEEVGAEQFAKAPVGTGPFAYKAGQLNDQVELVRYDDYYGGAPDLPPAAPARLKRAVFRMLPEPSTRVAALRAGEVHIIQAVPADMVAELEKAANIDIEYAEGTRCYAVELNNAQAPFDDVRVRRAINHAVNWELICSEIYGGMATRLATCFLPSGFGYDPSVEPYTYDPARARELLREAGYRTTD